MRQSMLGPNGAKLRLKVKKGEKLNVSKIFEAIEDRSKLMRSSMMSSTFSHDTSSVLDSSNSIVDVGNVLEDSGLNSNKEKSEKFYKIFFLLLGSPSPACDYPPLL